MSKCECCDRMCPAHCGDSVCRATAKVTLFRTDMMDRTGTEFCNACAEDSMESGLFAQRAVGALERAERDRARSPHPYGTCYPLCRRCETRLHVLSD